MRLPPDLVHAFKELAKSAQRLVDAVARFAREVLRFAPELTLDPPKRSGRVQVPIELRAAPLRESMPRPRHASARASWPATMRAFTPRKSRRRERLSNERVRRNGAARVA